MSLLVLEPCVTSWLAACVGRGVAVGSGVGVVRGVGLGVGLGVGGGVRRGVGRGEPVGTGVVALLVVGLATWLGAGDGREAVGEHETVGRTVGPANAVVDGWGSKPLGVATGGDEHAVMARTRMPAMSVRDETRNRRLISALLKTAPCPPEPGHGEPSDLHQTSRHRSYARAVAPDCLVRWS